MGKMAIISEDFFFNGIVSLGAIPHSIAALWPPERKPDYSNRKALGPAAKTRVGICPSWDEAVSAFCFPLCYTVSMKVRSTRENSIRPTTRMASITPQLIAS